jgi:hypothetical protein
VGKATRIAALEVYWPTSDTTQVFRDVAANRFVELSEAAVNFKQRDLKPLKLKDGN